MMRSCFSLGLLSLGMPLFGQFVYVLNAGQPDNGLPINVSGYVTDASTGALTPVPGSPFATFVGPVSIAADTTGRFAYVTNYWSKSISAYAINANSGVLTPIPGSPFAIGADPIGVAVDPSGRFAYFTTTVGPWLNQTVGNIWGYKINSSTGALTPIAGSPAVAGRFPWSPAVDPTGKYFYAPGFYDDGASGYAINPTTGSLTPVPGSPFTGQQFAPSFVAVHPTGKFLYMGGGDGTIWGYTINATTGALVQIPGSFINIGNAQYGITLAFHPTGKFLYATDHSAGGVWGFTVNPVTFLLTNLPGSPFPCSGDTQGLATDPTGKFAYVSTGFNNNVCGFTIDAAGELHSVPGSPFAAGERASVVVTVNPASTPDTTPPFVALFATIAGPPKQVQISSIDRQSGLASIDVLSCTNCNATTPAFAPGTKSAVLTTAAKINQTNSSAVKIKATDVAGNSIVFDPVDITIVEDGRVDLHEVTISSEEHVVEITNGKPGIHTLILKVHNTEIPVLFLKNGEARTIDIGYALKRGEHNVVKIFSYGKSGATTSIVFTER